MKGVQTENYDLRKQIEILNSKIEDFSVMLTDKESELFHSQQVISD